jgi:hypothetical protein
MGGAHSTNEWKIYSFRIMVGKPERNPRRRNDQDIAIDLSEIVFDGMDWSDLAETGDNWRPLPTTEPMDSRERLEFF